MDDVEDENVVVGGDVVASDRFEIDVMMNMMMMRVML